MRPVRRRANAAASRGCEGLSAARSHLARGTERDDSSRSTPADPLLARETSSAEPPASAKPARSSSPPERKAPWPRSSPAVIAVPTNTAASRGWKGLPAARSHLARGTERDHSSRSTPVDPLHDRHATWRGERRQGPHVWTDAARPSRDRWRERAPHAPATTPQGRRIRPPSRRGALPALGIPPALERARSDSPRRTSNASPELARGTECDDSSRPGHLARETSSAEPPASAEPARTSSPPERKATSPSVVAGRDRRPHQCGSLEGLEGTPRRSNSLGAGNGA